MTMTDKHILCMYVVVKHRNKRFGESNVPNDLIPDEIATKTSSIEFL